mgnify:CR=1 FL=1
MWNRQLLYFLAVFCLISSARGNSFPTREEVLKSLFPESTIQVERVFLTRAQQQEAVSLSGVKVPSALIARYIAWKEGEEVGRAYIDTHVVRTKKESLLICLDAKGLLRRIEVTAFREPLEYMVSDRFYAQYHGKAVGSHLKIKGSIRPVVGATLTTQATNQAVKRILAIDQVLRLQEGGPL